MYRILSSLPLSVGYGCDSCSDTIVRSRVICLECVSTDYAERTVDFCNKPECIAKDSIPQREDVSHLPTHLMVKTRDFFLLKDYYMTKQRAEFSKTSALDAYKDPQEDRSLISLPASPTMETVPLPTMSMPTGDPAPAQVKRTAETVRLAPSLCPL